MDKIDTSNMCSHLQKKLFDEEGVYNHIWKAMQNDDELTAVVRSRQLHIYRNAKKVLVLAGKAAPKIIRAKQTHAKQIKNFHVISYKKVDYGYQYSTDIIKWKGNYYSPYLYEEYKKGIISKVGIYKSEGILFYSHADLIKDSLLRNYLSLSIKRNIYLKKNYIIDKGRKYKVNFYQHKYYA